MRLLKDEGYDAEKLAAIRAALRGGYVNVLITDLDTAAALLDET